MKELKISAVAILMLMSLGARAWADTLVYPFLDLSQEEKADVAISICLSTSSPAMRAMNDRQSNLPLDESKQTTLAFSIAQKDSENKNQFYQQLIDEQYKLAYSYPVATNNQEKYELVKQLRDRELSRCGNIYGVQNIGQYLIYFYPDLRPKDFVYDEVNER